MLKVGFDRFLVRFVLVVDLLFGEKKKKKKIPSPIQISAPYTVCGTMKAKELSFSLVAEK